MFSSCMEDIKSDFTKQGDSTKTQIVFQNTK